MGSAGDSATAKGAAEAPLKEWFSAADVAALGLPGLPTTKAGFFKRAEREGWKDRAGVDGQSLSRPRKGRGGGVEFHWTVLPALARNELKRRGLVPAPARPARRRQAPAGPRLMKTCFLLAAWEAATEAQRKRAGNRAAAVALAVVLCRQPGPVDAAVRHAALLAGVSASALHGWRVQVRGYAPSLWAAVLLDDWGRASAAEKALP